MAPGEQPLVRLQQRLDAIESMIGHNGGPPLDDERDRRVPDPNDPLSGYYTEAQAARILRKSTRTIARLRAKRKLPYTVVGRTIYISPEHMQQMLAASEVKLARRRG